MDETIEELFEVTKQINELQTQLVPLQNRQQVLLIKLRKEKNADNAMP